MPRNETLLSSWVHAGLAVPDAGDGAWSWTSLGQQRIPGHIQWLLGDLLYDGLTPYVVENLRLWARTLADLGFDPKTGMVIDSDSSEN